ncbi:hypothetical protein JCM19233_235 [Vibrio astriarenae]|nr:hypothetical protein JCM19233_235 [Vibrio sp. C7]
MDQKELIRSVKSVLARLQSFGVSKEDIRNLLVLLFLLRWLRDEMNSFADFSREREHLELADRLNEIFSPNVRFREVHQNVYESVNLLRYYFNNENIRELDLSTKNYLFRDRRVVIEAINWLREWGELRLDRRKYVSQLFEVILKETRTPQTAQFSSSTLLSKLIVAIAAPKNGETILDPCVGEGGFLIAAHNTIEASDTDFLSQTSFTGYDLSEDAILIAMVRFYLSGGLNFRLNKRNGLYYTYGSEPELQYDIVLAQPPVGIKSEEYRHLARRRQFPVETNDIVGMFIQQSIHYLKPSGRAIVAVPEGVLFGKNRSQIDLRRFLVEYGYLEAVVRIPPKTLIEDSEIRGALLLLSNSKKRPRKVRFADLSSYIHQGNNKSNQVLPDVLVDQIIERLFCEELPEAIPLPPGMKEGTIGTGVSTRAFWDVSIDEIRRKNWDLSPIRNVDDALTLLLIDFKQLMGDEVKIDNLSKIAQINTGKSVRSTEQTVEETPYGYIRIRDVEDFKIQRFTTWLQEDLAHAYSDNQLYKGNILISKTGTIGKLALVDEKGVGAFAGNNFYILRINPAKVLPEYLLYYLSSSFCQDWLDSRKRGAVQQHINIDVIKTVPILLPSFEMQKRAVAQYDQHGTDVITFLKENSQRSDEKVIEHLVDMMEMEVASFDSNITSIEKSVTLLSEISLKLLSIDGAIDELNSHQRVWYSNVSSILIVLRDINKIPPGPVLLNILQDAKEQVGLLSEVLAGNYNLEERLLRVFGYVQAQIDRCIDMILANVRVLVSSSVGELEKNSDVEFSISLDNQGFLPLKNIVVETYPNLGIGDNYYLADHTSMEVPLSCKTTDKDRLSFTVMWRAETLAGRLLSGSSELAIKLVQFNEEFENFDTASNPYVTGSPLEPENGALVFYGRESFIQQVIRQIEGNGNVILLEGNRRAGKTSILKHLEGSNTIPNWLVVYSSYREQKVLQIKWVFLR